MPLSLLFVILVYKYRVHEYKIGAAAFVSVPSCFCIQYTIYYKYKFTDV